jgi:hypothetical protein
MMNSDQSEQSFGIFKYPASPAQETPMWIGRMQPNPAGLYDTIGNVEEMTISTFHLIKGDRIHGSGGGFVVKGGSFKDGTEDVKPGARQEKRYFLRSGPTVSDTMGFRVVISAVNTPTSAINAKILDEFRAESSTPPELKVAQNGPLVTPEDPSVPLVTPEDPNGPLFTSEDQSGPLVTVVDQNGPVYALVDQNDPLATLNNLKEKTQNPQALAAIQSVTRHIENYNIDFKERLRNTTKEQIWSLIYTLTGIRSNFLRIRQQQLTNEGIKLEIDRINNALKLSSTTADQKKELNTFLKHRQELLQTSEQNLLDFENSYVIQRAHYNTLLLDSRQMDNAYLDDALIMVRQDINGDDFFMRELKVCFDVVKSNIAIVRDGGDPQTIPRSDLDVDIQTAMPVQVY